MMVSEECVDSGSTIEDFESVERVNRLGFVGEMIERCVEQNGLYLVDLGNFV